MNQLIITKHTETRGNVTQYELEVSYIPNDYVGEVRKTLGTYTSFHDVWQKLKELHESEVI